MHQYMRNGEIDFKFIFEIKGNSRLVGHNICNFRNFVQFKFLQLLRYGANLEFFIPKGTIKKFV